MCTLGLKVTWNLSPSRGRTCCSRWFVSFGQYTGRAGSLLEIQSIMNPSPPGSLRSEDEDGYAGLQSPHAGGVSAHRAARAAARRFGTFAVLLLPRRLPQRRASYERAERPGVACGPSPRSGALEKIRLSPPRSGAFRKNGPPAGLWGAPGDLLGTSGGPVKGFPDIRSYRRQASPLSQL